jgi:hypothetical protein
MVHNFRCSIFIGKKTNVLLRQDAPDDDQKGDGKSS